MSDKLDFEFEIPEFEKTQIDWMLIKLKQVCQAVDELNEFKSKVEKLFVLFEKVLKEIENDAR